MYDLHPRPPNLIVLHKYYSPFRNLEVVCSQFSCSHQQIISDSKSGNY